MDTVLGQAARRKRIFLPGLLRVTSTASNRLNLLQIRMYMLRHFLIYLTLSVLVIVFSKYAHLLVVYVDVFFTYVNVLLTPIFSQTGWGLVIRKTLVLVLLPVVLTAIPALLYKAFKGKEMPHFIAITWTLWTVIVISDILVR